MSACTHGSRKTPLRPASKCEVRGSPPWGQSNPCLIPLLLYECKDVHSTQQRRNECRDRRHRPTTENYCEFVPTNQSINQSINNESGDAETHLFLLSLCLPTRDLLSLLGWAHLGNIFCGGIPARHLAPLLDCSHVKLHQILPSQVEEANPSTSTSTSTSFRGNYIEML